MYVDRITKLGYLCVCVYVWYYISAVITYNFIHIPSVHTYKHINNLYPHLSIYMYKYVCNVCISICMCLVYEFSIFKYYTFLTSCWCDLLDARIWLELKWMKCSHLKMHCSQCFFCFFFPLLVFVYYYYYYYYSVFYSCNTMSSHSSPCTPIKLGSSLGIFESFSRHLWLTSAKLNLANYSYC